MVLGSFALAFGLGCLYFFTLARLSKVLEAQDKVLWASLTSSGMRLSAVSKGFRILAKSFVAGAPAIPAEVQPLIRKSKLMLYLSLAALAVLFISTAML
jgi:hypothetical protein